jgi:hypothetical protein
VPAAHLLRGDTRGLSATFLEAVRTTHFTKKRKFCRSCLQARHKGAVFRGFNP